MRVWRCVCDPGVNIVWGRGFWTVSSLWGQKASPDNSGLQKLRERDMFRLGFWVRQVVVRVRS